MSQAAQTSYSINMALGYAGQLADLGWDNRTDSFINGGNVNINFGLAVVRGNADYKAILPNTTGLEFLGITERDISLENIDYATIQFLPSQPMPVLRSGKIFVAPEVNVAAGDPVYYRVTIALSGQVLGALRNTADSGNAVLIPNAVFDTSATAGNIAILYLK